MTLFNISIIVSSMEIRVKRQNHKVYFEHCLFINIFLSSRKVLFLAFRLKHSQSSQGNFPSDSKLR